VRRPGKLLGAMGLLVAATLIFAVSGGQMDDFSGGTTSGWEHGLASPNPPQNIADGGPLGAGDNYLEITSTGITGPGGKMVVFNRTQWSGDYIAAGVQQIEVDLANFGASVLSIRVVLFGNGSIYVSRNPLVLPLSGTWQPAVFPLDALSLSLASGTDDLNTVLSSVTEMRFISASTVTHQGDEIIGTLAVDNVTASTVPVELQKFSVE